MAAALLFDGDAEDAALRTSAPVDEYPMDLTNRSKSQADAA